MYTLFYDSLCPLCCHEVGWLKARDKENQLQLVDLNDEFALDDYPGLERDYAMKILHGLDEQGNWQRGLDATQGAWRAVGLGAVIAPLRWPLVKPLADLGYRWFARYRPKLRRDAQDCERCQR